MRRSVMALTAFIIAVISASIYGDDNGSLQGLYDGNYNPTQGAANSGTLPGYQQPSAPVVSPYQQLMQNKMQPQAGSQQAKQPAAQQGVDALQKSAGDTVITPRNMPESMSLVPREVDIIKPGESTVYTTDDPVEILDNIQGAFVNRTGIGDSLATLSLWGANPTQTRIMVDGIPMDDIMTGITDLNTVDTSNMRQIELVKGGMSSVYGSGAEAGVLNVINGSDKKNILSLMGMYGTDGLQRYNASSDYKIFNVDYALSFMDTKWDDYFVNSDSTKRSLNGKFDFSNDLGHTQLIGRYFKRDFGTAYNGYSATPESRETDEDYSAGINEQVDLLDPVKLKISGFLRSGDQRLVDPAEYQPVDARNQTKEYQGSIQGSYEEGGFISAAAGFEGNYRSVDSTDIGNKDRQNDALYANASLKLFGGSLVANGGGRLDNNSQFGLFTSWSGEAKYRFRDGLEIRGAVERSFALPSFSDMYMPPQTIVYSDAPGSTKGVVTGSNPGLTPEDFISYEAGIKKSQEKLSESVVWFVRNSPDMIQFTGTTQGITTTSSPENVKANTMGLEVKVDLVATDYLALSAQYNLLFIEDANNNTGTSYVFGGNNDNKVYRLDITCKLPFDAKLGVAVNYVDYKKDYVERALNPYLLLNARATQKLNDNVSVALQVDNILDNKDYETETGYPMPGRLVSASATMVF